MTVVSWLYRPSVLIAAATCLYSATVWTQSRPAAPTPPHERMESAHEEMLRDAGDHGKDAARLTSAVASAADPATAGAGRAAP